MRRITSSIYADFYLNAALKLKLGFKVLNKKAAYAKIYNEQKELLLTGCSLSVNTQVAARLATNKEKTSTLLKANRIPIPEFQSFECKEDAISYALSEINNGREIVVKPVSSSLARGVTVKPNTQIEVAEAVTEALSINDEIMVETFISGENYRVTVFQNEIIAVTWRRPGYVIGNGFDTVKRLIEVKNETRKKLKLPPIFLRKKDVQYLQAKKLTLQSVPSKDEYVQLQLGCDLEIGGERKTINLNSIPKKSVKILLKAVRTLGLNFAGIDFISTDITKEFTKTECAINEINSAPQLDVHYLDQTPPRNYAAERILRRFFYGDIDQLDIVITSPEYRIKENIVAQVDTY